MSARQGQEREPPLERSQSGGKSVILLGKKSVRRQKRGPAAMLKKGERKPRKVDEQKVVLRNTGIPRNYFLVDG